MIGNSITHNFENLNITSLESIFCASKSLEPGNKCLTAPKIWFGKSKTVELKCQSPKVVVVEIGTNNIDEKNFPTLHTASHWPEGLNPS